MSQVEPVSTDEKELEWYWSALLGIYFVVLVLVLSYMLYMLWPPSARSRDERGRPRTTAPGQSTPGGGANANAGVGGAGSPEAGRAAADANQEDAPAAEQMLPRVNLFGGRVALEHSFEVRLLLIVLLAGALGSYIHAATSFVDYVGNRKLSANWVWWYLLRPFVGAALALVFYFVVRGGFISPQSSGDDMNPFGIAALAGLVGMFSKQATDKLTEVFNTLFKAAEGQGDDKRKDGLSEGTTAPVTAAGAAAATRAGGGASQQQPTISGVEPPTGSAAGGNTLTITGTNFAEGAGVTFGDTPATRVTVVDSTAITVMTPAAVADGPVDVTVTNPDGTGGTRPGGFTYTSGG